MSELRERAMSRGRGGMWVQEGIAIMGRASTGWARLVWDHSQETTDRLQAIGYRLQAAGSRMGLLSVRRAPSNTQPVATSSQ